MKIRFFKNMNTRKIIAGAAAFLLCGSLASSLAQSAAPPLPPGVQDVVRLVKGGLGDDVVLAQIKSTGAMYNLSADQILFLKDQGVSQNVIHALLGGSGANAVAAPVASPPPAPAPAPTPAPYATAPATPAPMPSEPAPPANGMSIDYFRSQLSPYGTWVDVPGTGLCWRPFAETSDPYWRPYFDQGHWVYTDNGWFWQSDYNWGDIVFHYGRWLRDPIGWVWAPGYDWAPAWVAWRNVDGYCGWAPLPPAAVFRVGVGLTFGGRVGVDLDFGLGPDMFTFVSYDHFWDHHLHEFLVPHDRVRLFWGHSVIMNGYRFDHGHIIVEGLGRDRIARLTHHDVRVEAAVIRDARIRGHLEAEHRIEIAPRGRDDHRDDHRDDRHDSRRDHH